MLVFGGVGVAAKQRTFRFPCQVLFESLTLDTLVSAYIRTVPWFFEHHNGASGAFKKNNAQIRMIYETLTSP